jgi:hypothetical protein
MSRRILVERNRSDSTFPYASHAQDAKDLVRTVMTRRVKEMYGIIMSLGFGFFIMLVVELATIIGE